MIIKIKKIQMDFLLDILRIDNSDFVETIEKETFLNNDYAKLQISDITVNSMLEILYDNLFKKGFDQNSDLNQEGKKIQDLIEFFSDKLTKFYGSELKEKNKDLLEECIELLGNEVIIIKSETEKDKIVNCLMKTIPFGLFKVDWDKINHQFNIRDNINQSFKLIHKYVGNPSLDVYLIWDDASCAIVKTKLYHATRIINDVISVSSNTWIFCQDSKYVIECIFGQEKIGFID